MNDEGDDPMALEYWPARTFRVGKFRVSYCELIQYLFGVGLIAVILLVVVGVTRDLQKPTEE